MFSMALPSIQLGKLAYAVVQLVYLILVIVTRAFVIADESSMVGTRVCSDQPLIIDGFHNPCREAQVTYRIGWALGGVLILFSLLSVAGIGYYTATIGSVLALIAGFGFMVANFFIGDVFWNALAYISIPAVLLLLVIGVFLLINAGAKIHNSIARKTSSKVPIPVFAGLIILFSLCWIFFVFNHVVPLKHAGFWNKRLGLVIGAFVVMFALLLLSLSRFVKHGSILVSAIMMAFVTSLCWGATLNHSYDVNSETYIDPSGYLVRMAFWMVIMCVAAAMEDEHGLEPATTEEWSRMTAGEVNILVDDLGIYPKRGQMATGVQNFRTCFFFLFHASVPLTFMHLISPNPAFKMRTVNYHDGHFGIYVTAIILTMLLYLIYLLVPKLLKEKLDPSIKSMKPAPAYRQSEAHSLYQKHLEPVTECNAVEGLRVVRGREWAHDNQDGGEGKQGSLASQLQEEWWTVEWDCGGSHAYRIDQLSVAPKDDDSSRPSLRRRSANSSIV